jgi:tetratricopeptide (TPR) repeat protein
MLPVEGEPGIVPELYQTFARAKELALYRSAESTMHARQLLWACLADDPAFALGWAWLGRCCAYLAKFSSDATADSELAEAAFRRAFALDPELACAHQFYTSFEADTGHARQALIRLRERAGRLGCQPETFGGLVQVYRYCGLLAESVDAHQRAKDLDPAIFTSAPHTYFLAGNYEESIQAYSGRNGYYMDAAAWAALGDHSRAAAMLRERLSPKKEDVISRQLRMPMRSLLALMEGRRDEVLDAVDESKQVRDPEILVYLSRHYSYADAPEAAAQAIEEAAQAGFVVAPQTLRSDPWFAALRRQAAFPRLLAESERLVEEARSLL